MQEVFADTSGWGCLVDPTQPFHRSAAGIYRAARQERRRIVTTNYVLVELVALLTHPLRVPRRDIVQFIDGLKTSPHVEVVHVDAALDEEGWLILKRRPTRNGVSSIA